MREKIIFASFGNAVRLCSPWMYLGSAKCLILFLRVLKYGGWYKVVR